MSQTVRSLAFKAPRNSPLLSALSMMAICAALVMTQSWSSGRHGQAASSEAGSYGARAYFQQEAHAMEAYGKLPLGFEKNEGQIDQAVKFFSRGSGYGLFLTPSEAVLQLHRPVGSHGNANQRNRALQEPGSRDVQTAVVRMKLLGANARVRMDGVDALPGKSNYFIGSDPSRWRTGISQYSKVRYREIYRGTDLIYRGNQRQLEFDFEVHPGADPRAIHLGFEGLERLSLDPSGDLVLAVPGGEVRQHRPRVYQTIAGMRKEVEGRYVIAGKDEVRLDLADYDPTQTVIIDPIIGYSTYLGGATGSDYAQGIAVDASGNAYVTGYTYSSDFPTTPGAYQAANPSRNQLAFISKLNAKGNALVYSTFLGGSASYGYGIAVDAAGNAYVTGYTSATGFPTSNGAPQRVYSGSTDAFVTKLNSTGSSLLFSTYLGGSGYDTGTAIAVDSAGNASVTGYTDPSVPIIVRHPPQVKLM